MKPRIAVIGAPSALGLRPYDEGGARRLDLTPGALRAHSLVDRLGARDAGDVEPRGEYRDFERPENRCRNEDAVVAYSRELATAVAAAAAAGQFIVLLGGDCSILLGALLGLRTATGARVGLAYVDAHADFATLEESPSHSPCSMNLALAVGRAERPLSHLRPDGPLVDGTDVAHIGRRDDHQPEYGGSALASFGVLDLSRQAIAARGIALTVEAALERVAVPGGGFWTHFDADVLDPRLMPAVDSPLAGGLDFDQAVEVLRPLVQHPAALGMQLTIYDPTRDPAGTGAGQLALLLERAFAP